ncbi:MAG TPA: hypothetical protein VMQ62_00035, partial [Dongiaceae bacterium]|nr:hypothetical protein [Dongiaceae bacterium]
GGTLIAAAPSLGVSGLGAVTATGTLPTVAAGIARRRGALAWILAGILGAIAGAGAMIGWTAFNRPRPLIARYEVQLPKDITFNLTNRPALSFSPDGSMLAYIATTGGVSRLYVRRRDETEARPVPGSEGASNPVFSPDGRWIAFTGDNQLKKSSIDGSSIALTPVSDARGIAWIDSANILYAPEPIGGLFKIAATGGTPVEVTKLVDKEQERTHRWPEILPGGKTALFTIGTLTNPDNYDASAIGAVTIATGERRIVMQGAAMVRFIHPSTLVYARAGALYGIRFDPEKLQTSGDPVALAQGISADTPTGATHFAIAGDGTLGYISGNDRSGRGIFWVDSAGTPTAIDLPPGIYNDLRLSPDGTRMAVAVGSTGTAEIWVYDFSRSTFTRLTFTGRNGTPVWAHDGKSILYIEMDPATISAKVLRVPADGSRPPEEVIPLGERAYLSSLSPDGKSIVVVYNTRTQGRKSDILSVPLVRDGKPTPIAGTEWDEYNPSLSPNGRYLAFQSNDTGRDEIYVRDTSGSGGRWQISTLGGEEPSWTADGKELYYRSEDKMMVVPVQTAGGFSTGVPRLLFNGVLPMRSDTGISYDVDSAHKRFLMIRLAQNADPNTGLRVVLNWRDEMERLMAGR